MDRKLKSTLLLVAILILITLGAGSYGYFILGEKIEERQKKVDRLSLNKQDTEQLRAQLDEVQNKAAELDSILAMRKYNIPNNIKQSNFFNFVNKISFAFAPQSFVNIEYKNRVDTKNFSFYSYNLSGTAFFNDLYKLIYAIEQSKELKKISNTRITSLVQVDEDGLAKYLINFNLTAEIYFSSSDLFSTKKLVENRLKPNPLYDIFYPLIRNEIPPNINNLLDVQSAQLLALVPDGAFLSDASGNTYLLWEGDEVYLGYLTQINYDKNQVTFILNKGGIIEKVVLELEKENENKEE